MLCLTPTLILSIVCLCFTSKPTHGIPNHRTMKYSLPEPIPLKITDTVQTQGTLQAPFHLVENDPPLEINQLNIPLEMGFSIFSRLSSLERICCATVSQVFWLLSTGDEIYWEKICKEQEYLPDDLNETYYKTFLRCEKWKSPSMKLALIKTLPMQTFNNAYLANLPLLTTVSQGSTDLHSVSIEEGSLTFLRNIKSCLIEAQRDKVFYIDENQQFLVYKLPDFSLIKCVKMPFDRVGDMTQIGPDFFFIHYSEELGKQKITRFDSKADTFHELFVFQPKNIPRFCHNSPAGSIMFLGWGQTIYNFDYQGDQHYEIKAPTNPQASDIIGSRFLVSGVDNAVHLWDLRQKECIRNFTLPGDARIKAIKAYGLGLTICTEDAIYIAQLSTLSMS